MCTCWGAYLDLSWCFERGVQLRGLYSVPTGPSSDLAVLENGEIALAIDKSLLLDAGDIDGAALTASVERVGGLLGTGNIGTVGEALTRTYGTNTLEVNGRFRDASTARLIDALAEAGYVEDYFSNKEN